MRPLKKLFQTHAKGWTEEAALLHRRALTAARYVGVLPYNWNAAKRKMEYSDRLTRSVIFFTQYLLYLLYEGFLICRWISSTLDESASMKSKVTIQYMTLATMLTITLHSCSFFNRGNLHNFVNRLLLYVQTDFQRLPKDGRKLRKIGTFVRIIPFVASAIICLNMVTIFRRPTSLHLLTSLVPDVAKRQKWELVPFALIHGYLWCNQWATIWLYCTIFLSYNSAMRNAINLTRPNPQLSPERFYRATRKLEVLQGNYNALFQWTWWGCEVILVTLVVFGLCGSIWNEGTQALRQFIVSTFIMGGLLTLWKGLGAVFETSSQVHWEWRRRDGLPSLLFRKQIKCMRPIRVQVGGYFYLDAAMTLTLLSIIIGGKNSSADFSTRADRTTDVVIMNPPGRNFKLKSQKCILGALNSGLMPEDQINSGSSSVYGMDSSKDGQGVLCYVNYENKESDSFFSIMLDNPFFGYNSICTSSEDLRAVPHSGHRNNKQVRATVSRHE